MKNSLRISGGTLKGKKIQFDFKESLRPTSSKLKEILFNWLQFEIDECVCLDLFAGTGSLGIEALSRGSSKVIFVELNKKNYSTLSANLKKLDVKDKSKIFLAYEPVWAIGSGLIPKPQDLFETVEFIKSKFKDKLPKVLYGGSVNPQNITILRKINNIDGFLIGGASQNAKKFIDIVKKTYS